MKENLKIIKSKALESKNFNRQVIFLKENIV